MTLVKVPTVKAAPEEKPRIVLSKDEFRLLLARFVGMYRVMVLLAGCVGLRRSEIFALLWSDFDWLRNEVFIQRANVEGYEDDTKSESSNAKLPLHPAIVEALLAWRQQSPFNADTDYVFASPTMMGASLLSHVVGRNGHRADGAEGTDEAQHDQHDNGWIRSWSSRNESGCECSCGERAKGLLQ
jgi:integrase